MPLADSTGVEIRLISYTNLAACGKLVYDEAANPIIVERSDPPNRQLLQVLL
jgi:hypothetical protein